MAVNKAQTYTYHGIKNPRHVCMTVKWETVGRMQAVHNLSWTTEGS